MLHVIVVVVFVFSAGKTVQAASNQADSDSHKVQSAKSVSAINKAKERRLKAKSAGRKVAAGKRKGKLPDRRISAGKQKKTLENRISTVKKVDVRNYPVARKPAAKETHSVVRIYDKVISPIDKVQHEIKKEQEVRELVQAADRQDDSAESKRLAALAAELKPASTEKLKPAPTSDPLASAQSAVNDNEETAMATKTSGTAGIPHNPKIALVLGGGGARGAAHIGVLRVLEENNLKPDLIVANSMGAVIGAMYCAGVPLDKIEKLCVDGTVKRAFMPFPFPVQVIKKAMRPKIPFIKIKRYPGLYNGDSLEDFISKTVGEEHTKIESLEIPLVITVVNLLDGKAYRVTSGNLGRIVRESCSLPPIVKPVEYEGMLLADGGIRTNLPTMTARDIGVDVVIAVNVDETLNRVTTQEMRKLTLLANRVTSIMLAVRDDQFAKVADLVIHPDVSGISIISVDDKDYPLAIEAGRAAATTALPELKKTVPHANSRKSKGFIERCPIDLLYPVAKRPQNTNRRGPTKISGKVGAMNRREGI